MLSNQQMAMAGMPNAGGPVGGAPMMNAGSRSSQNIHHHLNSLNTYIYDYLIRQGFHDVARAMFKASKQSDNKMQLAVDDASIGRDVNGVDGTDSKEDVKRPADLPEPGNGVGRADNCFLEDWWCQFWDLHAGARNAATNPNISHYIKGNQVSKLLLQSRLGLY